MGKLHHPGRFPSYMLNHGEADHLTQIRGRMMSEDPTKVNPAPT